MEKQENNESKNKSIGKRPIPYKTYVKRTRTFAISTALATILATSVISSTTQKVSESLNSFSVNSSINRIVATDKNGNDLLSKYSYIVDRGTGDFAYDTYGLSKRIINVDAEYFDLLIYNIYRYMEYKTNNLDELFKDINNNIEKVRETNPQIYYKMKDVKSFEDYLRKLKFIEDNDTVSIEKYEKYGNTLNELYKDVIKKESKGKTK